MLHVVSSFLISLAIIAIGYTVKATGMFDERVAGKVLASIVFYVTLPAVILRALPAAEFDFGMGMMPFLCIAFSGIMFVVAWFISKSEPTRKDRGLFLFMSLGFNIGNFAFPLIENVYGIDGLALAAMFDFANALVIFIVCYALAVYFSAKDGEKVDPKVVFKKIATSPPLIAYFVGLGMNLASLQFPWFINDGIDLIANGNQFVVFIALGFFLNFKVGKASWKRVFKLLVTRYSIGIAAGITFFFFLPFGPLLRSVLLSMLVLPPGMATLVFVSKYEYDESLAGMTLNVANLISFGVFFVVALLTVTII